MDARSVCQSVGSGSATRPGEGENGEMGRLMTWIRLTAFNNFIDATDTPSLSLLSLSLTVTAAVNVSSTAHS